MRGPCPLAALAFVHAHTSALARIKYGAGEFLLLAAFVATRRLNLLGGAWPPLKGLPELRHRENYFGGCSSPFNQPVT
jgi:hypothetical protein